MSMNCKSCLAKQDIGRIADTQVQLIFRELMSFELTEGFICSLCYAHLTCFYHFKRKIQKSHKLSFNDSVPLLLVPDLVVKIETDNDEVLVKTEAVLVKIEPSEYDEGTGDWWDYEPSYGQAKEVKIKSLKEDKRKKKAATKKQKSNGKKGTRSFTCDVCSYHSTSCSSFMQHFKFWHPNGMKETEIFSCQFCSKVFRKRDFLILHQNREHSERGGFRCVHCESIFSSRTLMRKHQREVHVNPFDKKKTYNKNQRELCVLCGKLMLKRNLKTHVANMHNKEMKHVCKTCGRKFCHLAALDNHCISHHSDGAKPFQCDHCEMSFALKRNIKRHIKCFHFSENLKFRCKICLKGFDRNYVLKLHMKRTHRPDKVEDGLKANIQTNNFHCPFCENLQFSRKMFCLRHIQQHHK